MQAPATNQINNLRFDGRSDKLPIRKIASQALAATGLSDSTYCFSLWAQPKRLQPKLSQHSKMDGYVPMHSANELANDFRKLGVTRADTVMLHASVRAVGEIAGGPDSIHLALKSVLTEEGTLMMYANCPQYYDEVGRGNLTMSQERELLEKLPAFDPVTARAARDNGTLVEFFRTYADSQVNHHVARFVFWGKQAKYLMSRQPWNYALGRHSALERFLNLDGKIVLLGSDHDAVTFLHYVEHVSEFEGKRILRYQVPIMENGIRIWRSVEEVDTSDGAHANWPERFFAKIIDGFLTTTGNTGGRVGDAITYVIDARQLFDFAQPIMQAVASDPGAAVSLKERIAS